MYAAIGSPVTKNSDGTTVDQFQRAKDILLVVLPLLTTALGYWFGSAGRQQAEDKADQAHDVAGKTQRKLESVLASSTEQNLLEKAMVKDPEAFGTTLTPERMEEIVRTAPEPAPDQSDVPTEQRTVEDDAPGKRPPV
ncbi:hypothetical protein ABZ342_32950 [Amycolatopsis sp. NPDC005961]|uniref:hypothetical protein n=1 Tax=Amycolatopsis sp. NPDC005961 TaxID=3156720 RepID=UPI0033D20690